MNRPRMLKKDNYLKYSEGLVVMVIWIAVFTLPLIFYYVKDGYILQKDIIHSIIITLPFFVLFLVNHFLMVPQLLFKNKWKQYFVTMLFLVLLLPFGIQFTNKTYEKLFPPQREAMHIPPNGSSPLGERPPERRMHRPERRPPVPIPPFVLHMIIGMLLIGFDTALRMLVKWSTIEKEKDQLEKESVSNQLAFLKNQISPHFFMNTLNNIHALIDIDSEEAKEAVIQLSKLMRHILYDTSKDSMNIQTEIDFVRSYIQLMKLRFSEKVEITFQSEGNIPSKNIPPLLFTSLLENAFKHGISYQHPSFIHIFFKFEEDQLTLDMENSDHSSSERLEASGIGIENTHKRLELLYPGQYTFEQKVENHIFKTHLTIPL